MSEKKGIEKKSTSTKKAKTPAKKTTSNKAGSKTTKSTPTTTASKTKSSSSVKTSTTKTIKPTGSKTTKTTKTPTKKENLTAQSKKSVNKVSTAKTTTTKKTTTPKKKRTPAKSKTNSTVKIKENDSKTKQTTSVKKKPIKKITSTKKIKGKPISVNKKEEWVHSVKEKARQIIKNVKLTSTSLSKKINVGSKKIGLSLKKIGSKVVSKTKEIFKKNISNLKKSLQIVKNFLQPKKERQKNLVKKQDKKEITEIKEKKTILPFTKKTRRFLIGTAIFCIVMAVLLMIPYGVSTYKSGASNKTLDIPKFMKPKEECCNYSITFISPRSVWALKKEMEEIISSYERLNCDGKNYYYNAKENYTVTEYGVNKGIFLNQVYFTYGVGNSCNIDTKFKKLELLDDDFSIEDAKKDGNFVMEGDKVYNKKAYDDFMTNVNAKVPSTLRIVTTTKEGDVIITDLEYLNSGKYMVSYDATRDRNNQNPHSIIAYKFEHLTLNKNKLYAYNGDKLVIKKAKKYETFYLLTLPNE